MTVTFVYTDAPTAESATELAKFTTVTRPNFVTDHVELITDNRRVKNKTIRHYVLDVNYNEDNIRLVKYSPVSIKIHLKKNNIFNVIGSRLVIKYTEYNDNDNIYIIQGKEFSH